MNYKKMINSFSFAQMTSNSSGKTSASGTMGVLICIVGCFSFIWGVASKQTEVLTQSVIVIGMGTGLLGYRKSKDGGIEKDLTESGILTTNPPTATDVAPVTAPVIIANTDQPINS